MVGSGCVFALLLVSGSDATALVVKHQIERADTNQNGFLDRSEFLAFSLPIFSSFEFSAAAQLIDSFTAACTVVSSTAEELILKQCVLAFEQVHEAHSVHGHRHVC